MTLTGPNLPAGGQGDDWDPVAQLHRALVDDLAAALHLDAGAAEATQPHHYAGLATDLHETLDLDSGLAAIIDGSEPPSTTTPTPPMRLYFRVAPQNAWTHQPAEQLADQIRQLAPAVRLAIRTSSDVAAFGQVLALARAIARTLDRANKIVREIVNGTADTGGLADARAIILAEALVGDTVVARAIARTLAHTFDRARDIDRPPNLVLDRARSRASTIAIDLDGARQRAQAFARNLGRNLGRNRALAIARDLTNDHDRARTGVYEIVSATATLIGVSVVEATRAPDQASAGSEEFERLLRVLDQVMNDFTGADLRSATLSGASLEGIRWSTSTQWPAEWVEEIRRSSVEIEPGVFEIQGRGWGRKRQPHEIST